ncbi:10084_t:CDS:10 [Ambispora gerdemannii]|uniref:10084_t:CDS:1 n=1 Tax=Ambispora gerdemannii TaxID=144530 RepID=A0A9N8WBM0_9GLOM|nr:10084_t:CDS:10 [Ambispora gerdemannii]
MSSSNGFQSNENTSSYKKKTYIHDPIHNLMNFEDWVLKFIDTPQFQRLRDIKQLGSSHWVFPSASHNRFEHSLGVAWLSHKLVKRFQQEQPTLDLEPRDVKCVTLAGLCHDLGHGPFSHVFDHLIVPRIRPDICWKHEENSTRMLDYLIDNQGIEIDRDDADYIKALICGEPRDCYYTKPGIDFNADRLMEFSRVAEEQICYPHEEWTNLYDMFHTRHSLHRRVYNHPKGKAVELMITDAIELADQQLHIIDEALYEPEKFMKLNDSILHTIEWSTDDANARNVISRLKSRDLYKLVDEKLIPFEMVSTPGALERLKKAITPLEIIGHQEEYAKLQEKDVIVDFLKINFAQGTDNPLDNIKFYNRYEKGEYKRVFNITSKMDGSYLVPEQYEEIRVRIFTRSSDIEKKAFSKLLVKLWPKESAGSPALTPAHAIPKNHQFTSLGKRRRSNSSTDN